MVNFDVKKFLVVIEKGEGSYGAYSPDLPGCVAVGATKEEAEEKMCEAITFHLEGLREEGTGQWDVRGNYSLEVL